jgi:hypothetical protein
MKTIIAGVAALALMGGASLAYAQDTTVVHKESADGEHSKTVIHKANGSKTVIKKNGDMTKKVHTSADGDKTVVKKTTE